MNLKATDIKVHHSQTCNSQFEQKIRWPCNCSYMAIRAALEELEAWRSWAEHKFEGSRADRMALDILRTGTDSHQSQQTPRSG